jgi:predicted dehydrogenase
MLHSAVSLILEDETHPAQQVGVAVVGLGGWGSNLLGVLGDNFDVQVRWICDLDTSRLAKFRHRHPSARVTTRLDRILDDPGTDAVVFATPVGTHYDMAMRALAGGKHVFVQAPLATSAELADDLVILGHERSRIVMCGDTFLYSPPVRSVRRMIEARTLGDIYFISSSRTNLGLDHRVGSVIWDLGPHEFSILLYWLSEIPTGVRAFGRDSVLTGIADVAFITMNFASGIVVNVELSSLVPSKLRRTVVVGSERTVVYEDGGPEPVRLFDCGGGDTVSPNIKSYEPLELQLDEFVRAIRAGDLMEHETTLARSVVRIAEAADESLRLGGTEVSPIGEEVRTQLAARRDLAAV